jgi:ribosomal protein S12 methylthiotransferase
MEQGVAPKVSFVSLGCPKALVDSERIITRLRAEGYELARKHDGADLVIVNTCGFLDSAKQESLGAIGEAMAENGKVIVTGCMGAEPEQIEKAYPNVLRSPGRSNMKACSTPCTAHCRRCTIRTSTSCRRKASS